MRKETSSVNTRQGNKGKPALYVLVASLALALTAMASLLVWNGSNSPRDEAKHTEWVSSKQTSGISTAPQQKPAE